MSRRIPLFLILFFFGALAIQAAPTSSLLVLQNIGQYPAEVRYLALGYASTLWLTDQALWLTRASTAPLQITFPSPLHLEPSQPRPVNVSTYQGRDPSQWHLHIPAFGVVRYTGSVEVEIWEQNGQILLEPSAPLEITLAAQATAPRAFTLTPGHPTPLEQVLNPGSADAVSPAWRATPTGSPLLYGTFLGSDGLDQAHAIASDDLGRIYLAGQMLPVPPPFVIQPLHAVEAFIARFTPDGSDLEYLTLITADVEDWGKAIALSPQYEAYFAGETDSTNFPTTAGAYDPTPNGSFDAFLMKLGADGELAYSTLLGSTQWDAVTSVAIDALGNAYLTGDTWSPDFPTTGNAFDTEIAGPRDVFVAKFNPDGSQLLYSTFLGGDNIERAEAMKVSAENVVTLAGWTTSSNFPTTPNAYDTTYNNAVDAFATKLTLGSSTLTYSTFLGGSGEDRAYGLALDSAGNALLAGLTASGNFPATVGAFDTTYAGGPPACDGLPCPDVFVARLSADGHTLNYATFLGETLWEQANGLAVDMAGNVYLTGEVNSTTFPTSSDAYDGTLTGGRDAFLTVFNSTLSDLVYSTFLGGSGYDVGYSVWLGKNGGIFLGGSTISADFPTTGGAYDTTINGDYDGFAVLFSLPFSPYQTPTPSPTITPTGNPVTVTPSPTPTITPTVTPTPKPAVQIFMPLLNR